MHHSLTAHRRDTVLALLRPLHDGSASLVAEEPLGHDHAPVTRLVAETDRAYRREPARSRLGSGRGEPGGWW